MLTGQCIDVRHPLHLPSSISLFANNPVPIAVAHEGISRMATPYRRDAVSARLAAGDPSVAVVVPKTQRVTSPQSRGTMGSGRIGRRWRADGAGMDDKLGRGAGRQHLLQRVGLAPVDGETVLAPHLDDTGGEPTLIHIRHPFGGVLRTLTGFAAAVHLWPCQGQVQQVGCEPASHGAVSRTEPAVMGLGQSDDVFNVGLPDAGEATPCVGSVDLADRGDNPGLNRLRIMVVAGIVGGATVLWGDDKTPPGLAILCMDHHRHQNHENSREDTVHFTTSSLLR